MAKVQKGAADAAARLIAKYGKAAVTSAIRNFKPAKAVKIEPNIKKMKGALINNVNSKNLKGKIGKTTASFPSSLVERNEARAMVRNKIFTGPSKKNSRVTKTPRKFTPTVKKK
jgi:hypothetical protein